MTLKDVVVLITSTFSDIHAENDNNINEMFPMLSKSFKDLIDSLTFDFRGILSKEENYQSKIIETEFDNIRILFSFLAKYYGFVFEDNKNINSDTKRYDIIDVCGLSVKEMEIVKDFFNQICTCLNGDFDYRSFERSLFLFRDYSYLYNFLTSQEVINDSGLEIENDKIKLSDRAFEKIKQKFKDKNQFKEVNTEYNKTKTYIFSTECPQDWNAQIFVSKFHHYENDESNSKLANFKFRGGKYINTYLINQFEDKMALKFLDNKTFHYLEKILNQKGMSSYINESLNPRLRFSQMFKVNMEHDDVCLINSQADNENTLILSKFVTDLNRGCADKKSYKLFLGASYFMNEISFPVKSKFREKWNHWNRRS